MPSFDVVSEYDSHEVSNAVDQASKEISTRYDFKGADPRFELKDNVVTLGVKEAFQLEAMLVALRTRLSKRGIDLKCLQADEPTVSGREARQTITLRQGIDGTLGKKITKCVKDAKLKKVQAAFQDGKVRISGAKRDDLQQVISLLKGESLEMPLQFVNFRD